MNYQNYEFADGELEKARSNLSKWDEISLIDNDVISFIYDSMLDFETIPNTVQSIIFENGKEINRVVGFNKPKLQAIIENLSE